MGTTTSANGPTHREVLFPFACFPCFMISVPYVLNHNCSKYWYKSSLLLKNPWMRKLKPVNIPIPGGHSIVKNTGGGGWLDSLGSGILVGKDILGFFKNIDLDNC